MTKTFDVRRMVGRKQSFFENCGKIAVRLRTNVYDIEHWISIYEYTIDLKSGHYQFGINCEVMLVPESHTKTICYKTIFVSRCVIY